jgi:hypothetical protein
MSDKQRESVARWADLTYKIGVPLGLAALFFLKSSFATRAELQGMASRIDGIESAIAVMIEQNKTNERQDKRIEDHEIRLREVERQIALTKGRSE